MRRSMTFAAAVGLAAISWAGTASGEARSKGSKLVVERTRVEGQLDQDAARIRFEKSLAKIARCARRPGGAGATSHVDARIDLRLLVDDQGRVVSSTVERSSRSSPDLDKCVRARAMDVRYRARKGAGYSTVRYDLRFEDAETPLGILGVLRSAAPGAYGVGGLPAGAPAIKGMGGGGGTGSGTIGVGKVGTIGHGGRSKASTVTTGPAEVRGSLSQEVIQRFIRRHINEVRFCYERELPRHPGLTGRVVVDFVISPSGAVTSASVASTTLGNADAEQCIVRTVRRIAFPQAEGGGIVSVRYPFELRPAPAP